MAALGAVCGLSGILAGRGARAVWGLLRSASGVLYSALPGLARRAAMRLTIWCKGGMMIDK